MDDSCSSQDTSAKASPDLNETTKISKLLLSAIESHGKSICLQRLNVVLDLLLEEFTEVIAREIISFLSYMECTMETDTTKLIQNYVLAPGIDGKIPGLIITPPKNPEGSHKICLSSIRFMTGWFPSYIAKEASESWPVGGRYYCCIQEFDHKLAPNDASSEILYKSPIIKTTENHQMEYFESGNIDLILQNGISYLFYVIEFDSSLSDEKCAVHWNANDYLPLVDNEGNFEITVALPVVDADNVAKSEMVACVNYAYSGKGNQYILQSEQFQNGIFCHEVVFTIK